MLRTVLGAAVAFLAFETILTVPTAHLAELSRRLARAGFTLLDTGDRVATDEGPDGEATVRLVHMPVMEVELVDPETTPLGIAP